MVGLFRTAGDATFSPDIESRRIDNLARRRNNHPSSSSLPSLIIVPPLLDSKQVDEMSNLAESNIWPMSVVHCLADVLSLLLLTSWSVPRSDSGSALGPHAELNEDLTVRRENKCEQLLVMLQCILT